MSKKLRPSQSQFDCPLKKRDFEFGPVLPALDCPSTGACLGSQYHLIWIEIGSRIARTRLVVSVISMKSVVSPCVAWAYLIPFKGACLVVGSWLNTRKGCVLNISVPGG